MCGIAGLVAWGRASKDELEREAAAMGARLAHRGPDDAGTWSDDGVALAHRRLAIIDPSPRSAQPMCSPSGRFVLVYNGEAYNYAALADRLRACGVTPAGPGDTHTLAAGLDVWDPVELCRRVDGMFALAVWDRRDRRLHLARDRFGEKPLLWGAFEGRTLFASELQSLHAVAPGLRLSAAAAAEVMATGTVRGTRCIDERFRKVAPATVLSIDADGLQERTYWDPRGEMARAATLPRSVSREGAVDELEPLLTRVVRSRMVADVPVGAFLSGGVDSTAVVAAAVRDVDPASLQTFTLSTKDRRFDEADEAARVATALGTTHRELHVESSDLVEVCRRLPELYDEPFADSSQVPTFVVARLASAHVKVVLTGDGGDELFGGYNRHVYGDAAAWLTRNLPGLDGEALRRGGLDTSAVDAAASRLPRRLRLVRNPGAKFVKLAGLLGAASPAALYRQLTTDVGAVALLVDPPRLAGPGDDRVLDESLPFSRFAMLADVHGYLHDDILAKVDRATMRSSLEARAPFLSPELLRWAWSLPRHRRQRWTVGKQPLRDLLGRWLPDLDLMRAKSGFGVPIDAWLRDELRGWADEVLSSRETAEVGLDRVRLQRVWREHLDGRDHTEALWRALMLTSWFVARRSSGASERDASGAAR